MSIVNIIPERFKSSSEMWQYVERVAKAGHSPQIVLTKEHLVRRARQSRGRPRTRDGALPFKHYAGARGRGCPYCLNRGCRKRLRINQRGACSPSCADAIVSDALYRLWAAQITKGELLAMLDAESSAISVPTPVH
jgi:hypothetical protein